MQVDKQFKLKTYKPSTKEISVTTFQRIKYSILCLSSIPACDLQSAICTIIILVDTDKLIVIVMFWPIINQLQY